jgi:hypothetical protein
MAQGLFRLDDPLEVTLSLWAHAHGLILLNLAGRFGSDERQFRTVYRRSIRRLLDGLVAKKGDIP